MTQNLVISFKASDFPLGGLPSLARATAAAAAFADEVTRLSPGNFFPYGINNLLDGSILVVYEPYPFVGDLVAIPFDGPDGDATGTVVLRGQAERRTEYARDYPASAGHAVGMVDVLSPRYLAERSKHKRR